MSKGLNLFEVNVVNFFFFATLFACEIPTGAFADVFGRKLSFVIACFLMSLGMFVYGLSTTFWFFVLAEVIAAAGSTFASGAFQAWVVDRLRLQGYEGPVNHIFAKEQQVKNAAAIIATILGAFLADRNIALPWFVGGVVMCVAGISAWILMHEDGYVHKRVTLYEGIMRMKGVVCDGIRYSKDSDVVRFILLLGVVQFFAVQAPNMQWQPFFGQFLHNKTSFGFIFACIAIATMAGSAYAPMFLRAVKEEKIALCIAQGLVGIGLCATVLFHVFVPAISFFLIHEIARGLFIPLKDAYLNDNIPSEQRATLLSFGSVSHHIGGMIGLLVSGAIAQWYSIPTAWTISGLVLVCSAFLLFIKTRR